MHYISRTENNALDLEDYAHIPAELQQRVIAEVDLAKQRIQMRVNDSLRHSEFHEGRSTAGRSSVRVSVNRPRR